MIHMTEDEFKKLSSFINQNFGIFIKEEKKEILGNKLEKVLYEEKCNNFTEYYNKVISDKSGSKLSRFINVVTTNHTFFMRESDHFYYFKNEVLPYLKKKVTNRDLRIWCAACSSGEEAYTIAMILDEFFSDEKANWDTKVLATDLSTKVLNIAKKGIYNEDNVKDLPCIWKMNYLKKIQDKNYEVKDKIKNEVIYRRLNLMNRKFPFKKKFHVIFCRNAMIYFNNETRTKLINKFYDLTEPGGYLFIGHSETINRDESRYRYVKPAVYRKE
ncbi:MULTISPECIES: CheR family methyltransferase [Clostridium]|uniref:CheR family methyltransferase n=1 Tax=Clostridium TaxID=1485 RepID=UPI000825D678|nr:MULTISPECIES: protein-glutamate O-methyltransferase CheR [Clostridium]PJI08204.1 chemotaxis protein CheR [Clostridium sp. CT7]